MLVLVLVVLLGAGPHFLFSFLFVLTFTTVSPACLPPTYKFAPSPPPPRSFWNDSGLEIIVLVEGIDAPTSATIQSRHSYNALCDDIAWDQEFAGCVSRGEGGEAVVDFAKFHKLRHAPPVDDLDQLEQPSCHS